MYHALFQGGEQCLPRLVGQKGQICARVPSPRRILYCQRVSLDIWDDASFPIQGTSITDVQPQQFSQPQAAANQCQKDYTLSPLLVRCHQSRGSNLARQRPPGYVYPIQAKPDLCSHCQTRDLAPGVSSKSRRKGSQCLLGHRWL